MKPLDIQRLCQKANLFQAVEEPLAKRRRIIQQLNETRRKKLRAVEDQFNEKDVEYEQINNQIYVEGHSIEKPRVRSQKKIKLEAVNDEDKQKNPGVGETDKMLYDKKFKNYLNHKLQFALKAKRRQQAIREKRRKQREGGDLAEDYYNEDQILSNTGSDYQYKDAEDMYAAYETLATGKRKKKGTAQLFYAEKFQLTFRFNDFQMLLSQAERPQKGLISKEQLLNYLFDEPMIMMLYSVNPFLVADEISEFETEVPSMLNFQEFSNFLITDRQPTYFQYTAQNLQEARKIGRGLKCAPIVGKWIDETDIYEELCEIFKSVDMFGNNCVQRAVLAKKLKVECEKKRQMDVQVVQIVNINKLVSIRRLIYELEHEMSQKQKITKEEFQNFLLHYSRKQTPEKQKLITKLIMAGKYDTSFIYVISQEVLDFLRVVFEGMQKFAEYFVRKEKFVSKVTKAPKYRKLKGNFVRSETNRFIIKQNVEQTLCRMLNQADEYIDIEDIMDFFTNRGRPHIIQYKVYLANLEVQLARIEEQERIKWQNVKEGEEPSTSSDEEFSQQILAKQKLRKKKKLQDIHNSMKFQVDKKYNVTIPVGFGFDQRDKNKKMSIREKKVKEMLDEKRKQEDELMKPIKPKQVPQNVKQNLFERIMKDQERERLQRLQRFREEIKNSMVPMSDRLTEPKKLSIHCDFSHKPYQFVARPMPWYCEVNLIDRINKKKQERRQRILEEIINRHHDNDLPEGVIRMLERHEEIDRKRAEKRTVSTKSIGDCTFMPKITKGIPNFEAIHAHLQNDFDIRAQNVQQVFPEPFSFENREHRSRTTHDNCVPKGGQVLKYSREFHPSTNRNEVKSTEKHDGLIKKRMQERAQKIKQAENQERNNQIRQMRREKFAPQVRRVLKKNQSELSKSRNKILQRLRHFQREQKKKMRDYENEMINIYTKVWNKPLLLETGLNNQAQMMKEDHGKTQKRRKEEEEDEDEVLRKQYHQDYEEKRRRVIEQEPGKYLLEDQGENMHDHQFQGQYDEDDFEHEFLENNGLHTS